MRHTWLFIFALACTGPGDSDSGDTATEDSGSEDTGTPPPTCDLPSVSEGGGTGASISGIITGPDGNPLHKAEIGLCKQVCRTVCTDTDGSFLYNGTAADTFSFHVRQPHEVTEELQETVWPITTDGTTDIVQNHQLLDAPTMIAIPSTAAEVEPATGLFITVGQGDLEIIFQDDPTEIGASALTTPNFPLPAGTFVGGWFLEPYNSKSEAGLPVRFQNSFGVATSGQVHVWASSYDDFAWLDLGTFTESGGFLVADNATVGKIPVVATLVLMDESSL